MNKKSKKPTKTSKKTKKSLKQYKSKSMKALEEFMELLHKNRDVLAKDITKELESILLKEGIHTKNTTSDAKMPSKSERIKNLKNMEREMAINDFPFNEYSTKHVNRIMRLLDVDKKRAKELSESAKRQHNLHVPYKENALDKTMMTDCDIQEQCISSINGIRESAKEPFSMSKTKKIIDRGLKELKKSYSGIINKWKITNKTLDKTDYIYVDVNFNTTLNTHRHIFKLSPTYFVQSSHFSDDTNDETIEN